MSRKTIVDTQGLMLWLHEDTKIIHHELQRYPGAEVLEGALQKGLELIQTQGVRKWLSDDRRGGALPKSHHEWGEKVWGPAAAAAGWRYWALLPPKEALGSANMRRLARVYAALGVTVETFSDPDLAMKWLVSCE